MMAGGIVLVISIFSIAGIALGIIIQLINYFIKRKKAGDRNDELNKGNSEIEEVKNINESKQVKQRKRYVCVISLIPLLSMPILLQLSSLEPPAHKYDNPMDKEIIDDSFYIKYTEGSSEYEIEIIVTKDKMYSYRESTTNLDSNGNLNKTILEEEKRQLTKTEYDDLYDFIFHKTEFTDLKNDLSTEIDINDAPAAFIELKHNAETYRKGGYYPFEYRSFRNIKIHLFELKEPQKSNPYEEIVNSQHPNEDTAFRLAGNFNSQLLSQLDKCIDSYITVEGWNFDKREKEYNIDVSIEVIYPNDKRAEITGVIEWRLEGNVFSFHQKNYMGTITKRKEINKVIENIEELK